MEDHRVAVWGGEVLRECLKSFTKLAPCSDFACLFGGGVVCGCAADGDRWGCAG